MPVRRILSSGTPELASRPQTSLSVPQPGPRQLMAEAEAHLFCLMQPIVDLRSGIPHGYEALIRGHETLGFADPLEMLDRFAAVGLIVELEILLHQRAVQTFSHIIARQPASAARLFLNLDPRALRDAGPRLIREALRELAARGVSRTRLTWEFSERERLEMDAATADLVAELRTEGVRFAADDFGQGHSDVRLLFDQQLDYIKIDRFFVQDLARSGRRRLFVSKLTCFAHVLGMTVIVEGVETAEDLRACRDLGCDMGQGWFISSPIAREEPFAEAYPEVAAVTGGGRRPRIRAGDRTLRSISDRMLLIPAVLDKDPARTVIDLFGSDPDQHLCPVVDGAGAPVGVISERVLRPIVYNPFGRDLLRNGAIPSAAGDYALPCPRADIDTDLDTALEVFASQPGALGLLVTEAGRYLGLLLPSEMVADAVESRLADASARNPLTGLPGNLQVQAAMARVASLAECGPVYRHICYFDFDNFKPFNDVNGFRVGDRAITLFAEALRRSVPQFEHQFIGHIGGDDFVAILQGAPPAEVQTLVSQLLRAFAAEAAALHSAKDRERGWYATRDRYGELRRFSLLRASAATITLGPQVDVADLSWLDPVIGRLKSIAKADPAGAARFEATASADLAQLSEAVETSGDWAPEP